jgi:hypothetical protein
MNTKQIAEEAALEITIQRRTGKFCPETVTAIIQSAIEKATEQITNLHVEDRKRDAETIRQLRDALAANEARASDTKRLDWGEANVFRFVDLLKTLMPTAGASVNIREAIDAAIQEENQ